MHRILVRMGSPTIPNKVLKFSARHQACSKQKNRGIGLWAPDSSLIGTWSDLSRGRMCCRTFGNISTQSELIRNLSSLTQIGLACPLVQVNFFPMLGGSRSWRSLSKSCAILMSSRLAIPFILSAGVKIELKSPQIVQGMPNPGRHHLISFQKFNLKCRSTGP